MRYLTVTIVVLALLVLAESAPRLHHHGHREYGHHHFEHHMRHQDGVHDGDRKDHLESSYGRHHGHHRWHGWYGHFDRNREYESADAKNDQTDATKDQAENRYVGHHGYHRRHGHRDYHFERHMRPSCHGHQDKEQNAHNETTTAGYSELTNSNVVGTTSSYDYIS